MLTCSRQLDHQIVEHCSRKGTKLGSIWVKWDLTAVPLSPRELNLHTPPPAQILKPDPAFSAQVSSAPGDEGLKLALKESATLGAAPPRVATGLRFLCRVCTSCLTYIPRARTTGTPARVDARPGQAVRFLGLRRQKLGRRVALQAPEIPRKLEAGHPGVRGPGEPAARLKLRPHVVDRRRVNTGRITPRCNRGISWHRVDEGMQFRGEYFDECSDALRSDRGHRRRGTLGCPGSKLGIPILEKA